MVKECDLEAAFIRTGVRGFFPSAYAKRNPEQGRESRRFGRVGLKTLKQQLSGASIKSAASSTRSAASLRSRISLRSMASSTASSSLAPYSEYGAEKGRFKVEYYGSTEVDEQHAGEETLIEAILQVGGEKWRNSWWWTEKI